MLLLQRFVPLTQPLLDAGFLDYVAEVKKSWPSALVPASAEQRWQRFGKQMSKQFADLHQRRRGIKDDGMGMHAFRHTLATRLDRAGVSEESSIARITGHTPSGGILPKFYIDPPTLAERVAVLAKFEPGVSLPNYTKDKFKEALKDAHKTAGEVESREELAGAPGKEGPVQGADSGQAEHQFRRALKIPPVLTIGARVLAAISWRRLRWGAHGTQRKRTMKQAVTVIFQHIGC